MRTQKAYTLIETLLVLFVLPLILALIISLLKLISAYDFELTQRQNFIGIIQLRKRIAVGTNISLHDLQLVMSFDNREINIYCNDDKLIETEGYMEYLIGLEVCEWEINSGLIYLNFKDKSDLKKVFIGYAK